MALSLITLHQRFACSQIGKGALFVASRETNFCAFDQRGELQRIDLKNVVQTSQSAGVVAVCAFGHGQEEPGGRGRVRILRRALRKVDSFFYVSSAKTNVGKNAKRQTVLPIELDGLAQVTVLLPDRA